MEYLKKYWYMYWVACIPIWLLSKSVAVFLICFGLVFNWPPGIMARHYMKQFGPGLWWLFCLAMLFWVPIFGLTLIGVSCLIGYVIKK